MTPTPPTLWTAADIEAHCERYGLHLSEPLMRRMHELSSHVSLTGMSIPRMPSKDCEPALVFTMPTTPSHRQEP
jgi:hypothetical protein